MFLDIEETKTVKMSAFMEAGQEDLLFLLRSAGQKLSVLQLQRVSVGGLTTFQRSLTMQLGGRMSACSDVAFMLPLSWRAGTRHCICQPDRTRAAPSLKEPLICVEKTGVRQSLGPGPWPSGCQTSHSSADQGAGWEGWTGTEQPDVLLPELLTSNLPEPVREPSQRA